MMKWLLVAGALVMATPDARSEVARTSFTVASEPGIEIAIRAVAARDATPVGDPVVLLHGARVPGIPSFDLAVDGGSLAADLAEAGLAVYIVDLRGYGASTRPAAMSEPRRTARPLVRSGAAVRDLAAAIGAIRARTGSAEVAILGWATGGHWAGLYAALHPETVSRIVFYNTLYGYTQGHLRIGQGSGLSDPARPDRFNLARFKNYRLNTAASLLGGWDRSIPIQDKAAWRAPSVAEAYVAAAMASDPTAARRDPPSFRSPSGALADSFLLATGAALWDARLIEADALIIRSGLDFWSRPQDVARLKGDLEARHTGTVRVLEIAGATHYVHLDRPERGRQAFVASVISFLSARRDR